YGFLSGPTVHIRPIPVTRFPLVLIHPAEAHLEGKPRQRVLLCTHHHRETAQCQNQMPDSNHVATSSPGFLTHSFGCVNCKAHRGPPCTNESRRPKQRSHQQT